MPGSRTSSNRLALAVLPRLACNQARLGGHDSKAGLGHVTDDRGLWPLLWQANRAVAEAYVLSAEDFPNVLGKAPGVAK